MLGWPTAARALLGAIKQLSMEDSVMSEPGLCGSLPPSVPPSVNGHCSLGTRSGWHLTPLIGTFQEKDWRAWGNANLVDGKGSPEKIFTFFCLPFLLM